MRRQRRGFSIVEVLCVLVLIALVAVPVLGLGSVDHRAAAKRLERMERLSALRELAEQLAVRPLDRLRAGGGAAVLDGEWIRALSGRTLAPGADGVEPVVRVQLDEHLNGATGLHRITLALELPAGQAPLIVTRLMEER
jgi:prepilin-type N-terminal cleavage/methylation domain-containing protein